MHEASNRKLGLAALVLSYAALAAVIIMIVPSHTYTEVFWLGVIRETAFNFASWVH